MHVRMAEKADKPLVLEEFGYPRDFNSRHREVRTDSRDAYYQFVFDQLTESKARNGVFVGCNFWGWGGEAEADSATWASWRTVYVRPSS